MTMGLSMRMSIRLAMECSVCRQILDDHKRDVTAIEAAIFGAASYAVCCACGMEVVERHDRNYRKRWRRWRVEHVVSWPRCACGPIMRSLGEVGVRCKLPRELHAELAS
jgi:hypothetical protein